MQQLFLSLHVHCIFRPTNEPLTVALLACFLLNCKRTLAPGKYIEERSTATLKPYYISMHLLGAENEYICRATAGTYMKSPS